MNGSAVRNPGLFALLIGIDRYLPDRFQDGLLIPPLRGCVRDVSRVEAFLGMRLGLPRDRILKLTATCTERADQPEARERMPTYGNMVGAFKEITDRALPGDQVYIHYSGHGGRARTIFPERKGEGGIDEVLVPTDIADPKTRYLRDIELVKLLGDMAAKGLMVTVVVDSCHSGGMTRGRMTPARCIDRIDMSPRPVESLVGSRDELIRAWDAATENGSLTSAAGSGWLPEPRGYTLLAACRASERAYEHECGGMGRHGLLTYWMLDTLEDTGPNISYGALHGRMVVGVHGNSGRQTPQLQGESDRIFLGGSRDRPFHAVPVIGPDEDGGRILVGAGSAHGLREGARLAVYPAGSDLSRLDARQAIIELSRTRSTDSWAVVVKKLRDGPIERGAQAVPLGAGSVQLVRRVWLEQRQELPAFIDQVSAMEAVRRALDGNGWVEAADAEYEADFSVAVNGQSEYEIRDPTGQAVRNLVPAIKVGASSAAAAVVGRLAHLAKYNAVRQLAGYDSVSPLGGKLEIDLIGRRAKYEPGTPFEPQSRFTEPGLTPTLTVGEWTALRIRNAAARSLHIAVLDLQPDWGITQIFPSEPGALLSELGSGRELVIPLQAWLPPHCREGGDVLKVLGTLKSSDFRWLELPSLDRQLARSPSVRTAVPASSIEQLLAAFAADKALSRNLIPAAYSTEEWVTASVEVHIQRKAGQSGSHTEA